MKPTKSILILLTLLLISNCGDKVREETKESYDGNTKTLMKFKGNVFKEVLIEQITYTKDGDTLILEKPLEKLKILRSYYENGNIKEKQNFKNGKQYGKYTSYYENGHIKEEKNFNYVNGFSKRDGKYISYYENGGMKVKSNFKNGKQDGKSTDYYENGQIKEEKNFIDGKLDGKYTAYYKNGDIIGNGYYKIGVPWSGLFVYYYENGDIKEEKNFIDGKLDGKYTSYYENGQIRFKQNFKNGKMNKRTYYYKNGQIRKNVHRISSVELKEEIKKTYDNGNNEYVVRYTNDIVKGATIDGKPIKRGDRVDLEKIWYYKNGCIEVAHYSKDGKKDYYKRFMNFITVQYYENGQIEVEMSKKRGFNTSKEKEPDGKYIYYYRNGQIKVEGNYISGNKEGLITYYYENGQIMKEENYKEETDFFGYKNGKFTYYYENGQVKEEGNWKSSMFYNQYMDRKVSEKKVGEWTSYNLDGSINKVETNHKKSSRKTNNTDYDKKGCQDAYGKWHSHMITCATCGTSYCVEYLQYGEYCSQECCGAYEGLSPKCGY